MKDYKKILEGVMNIINTTENSDIVFAKICNYIDENCPELKEEIEDERIRKVLIELVKCNEKSGYKLLNNVPTSSMVAWLEKQGTRPRYNIGDILCDKLCTTLNKDAQPNMEIVDIKNGMYICDKGSFPVSQQDEYELVGKKIDMKPVESVSNELREASFKHAEKEVKNQTCHGNLKFELAYSFEEGAKWKAEQFEKERLKQCDTLTEEQAKIEQDFVVNFIKKNNCTPTFIDAIEYGMKLKLKDKK